MKLQQRLVLTLCAIAVILVAPALYGISALTQLRQVATDLSTRDAAGALALGRLQTAYGDVEAAERIYVALAGRPATERDTARRQLAEAITRVPAELDSLTRAGYRDETARAAAAWRHLREQIGEEQRLIEAGQVELADQHRPAQVDPAFGAMSRSLVAIRSAIDARSGEQLVRAGQIADVATTTTRLALAAALGLALVVSAWLARNLLLPIRQLRLGMAEVAEGDFQPEAQIPAARPDELGDLARSFTRMTQQLLALDRLKAEFVSIASHELKTPLTPLAARLRFIQRKLAAGEPISPDSIDKPLHSLRKLTELINDLLDASSIEHGRLLLHLEPQPLDELVRQGAEPFRDVSARHRLRVETPPEPLWVNADRQRLTQVITHLVDNAIKYSPSGGEVVVSVHPHPQGVELTVADQGIGIPPAQQERLFERFYRAENASVSLGGLGLGLYITRDIVDRHGGRIWAESEPGRGSRFHVVLPRIQPAELLSALH